MAKGGPRRRSRPVVPGVGPRKEPIERGLGTLRLGNGGLREPEEAGRGLMLRSPEALEVQPAPPVEDEGPALLRPRPGHRRARRERFDPGLESGKRFAGGFRPGPARHFGERETGVPGSRRVARERGCDRHLRPRSAVDLRGQRAEVPVDVRDVALPEELVEEWNGHASPPRRSRSSPCTRDASGRSNQTPRPMPAAGAMPRTKR